MFIYIFLLFFLICFSLVIIIKYTTIEIELNKLEITIPKKNRRTVNQDYKIIINIYLFEKLKVIKLILTKEKLEKKKRKINLKKIEKKIIGKNNKLNFDSIQNIKQLKINLNKLDLKIRIGLNDAACTAILVGGISSIIGLILNRIVKNDESFFWNVIPLYEEKIINININFKIKVKLINIIRFLVTVQ